MAHRTTFAGLAAPDPGDSIEVLNSDFIYRNPDLVDQFLKIGAVSHRHDGHLAQPNPQIPVTLQGVSSGGSIPGGVWYVTYTLTDVHGGETTAASSAAISLTGQVPAPSASLTASVDFLAGIMPAGNYAYAETYVDGQGGETNLGPTTWAYVGPGFASAEVRLVFEPRPIGAIQRRLWRSYEGEDWHLVIQTSASAFTDAGFDPPDNPARPPVQNDTLSTNSIIVTLPTTAQESAIASAAQINVYFSTSGAFLSPAYVESLPIACAGASFVLTSDITVAGTPPAVSTCLPGAAQINPDTDMLDWHWKRPVATQTALPSGARGDVRMTLNTGHLWGVLSASGAVSAAGWVDLLGITQDVDPSVGVGGSGASPLVDPLSYLEFVSAGGGGVSVTSLGGGSARVSITGVAGVEVAASGGASAIGPEQYIEFAASGRLAVAPTSLGNGSARVLIGMPALRARGAFSSATAYDINDMVQFGGSALIAEQQVPSGFAASGLGGQLDDRFTTNTLGNYTLRKQPAAINNGQLIGAVAGTDITWQNPGIENNASINSIVAVVDATHDLSQGGGVTAHYTSTTGGNPNPRSGVGLYLDDNNYIEFTGLTNLGAGAESFGWTGRVAGVALGDTQLTPSVTLGTNWWITLIVQGANVQVLLYTSDPALGAAPAASFVVAIPSGLLGGRAFRPMAYCGSVTLPAPILQELRVLLQYWAPITQPRGGTTTLAGGSAVVTDSTVTAVTRIQLTAQDNSSTGALRVSARSAGSSFTITSSNAGDTGLVAYDMLGS